MGIPRLTQWLRSTFPDAFSQEAQVQADHVYVDVNCVLHEALTALGGSAAEEQFLRHVFQRLDQILDQVRCSASLFIAVDGAAAAAKVAEQRRRRRARQEQAPVGGVTTNMLTPGVPVMDRVAVALREHLRQLQEEDRLPRDLRFSVSGPDEAGEGEHKISLQMLRKESEASGADEHHVIVGTDSDLLLVPVALRRGPKFVAVARQDGPAKGKPPMRICHSERMVEAMARQLLRFAAEDAPPPAAPTPKDLAQLRLDFLLMMLFRGNDYLPALVSCHEPADLWPRYLRWRQSKDVFAGIVQIGDGEGQEPLVLTPAQLSAFLAAQGSGWLPGRVSGIIPKEGVAQYLEALLWCLETYSTGVCPDFHRRFPAHLKEFASASLMAEEIAHLPTHCFQARHSDGLPLSPLCCALAVLPVADAQRVVLPAQPALGALLQEGGLLGEVAKMECCTECRRLTAAVEAGPVAGKKAQKHRKALEVHKRQHKDMDSVSLEALDEEVRRLCAAAAAAPPDPMPIEPKEVDQAREVAAPAPQKGAKQKKRKRG